MALLIIVEDAAVAAFQSFIATVDSSTVTVAEIEQAAVADLQTFISEVTTATISKLSSFFGGLWADITGSESTSSASTPAPDTSDTGQATS